MMSLLRYPKIHARNIHSHKSAHFSFAWLAIRKSIILQSTKQERLEFQWKFHRQQETVQRLQFNRLHSKLKKLIASTFSHTFIFSESSWISWPLAFLFNSTDDGSNPTLRFRHLDVKMGMGSSRRNSATGGTSSPSPEGDIFNSF